MLNFCWIILNRNTSLKAISTTKVCSGVGYKNKQPSSEPILHMGFLFEFSLFRNLISNDVTMQYLRNVLQEMDNVMVMYALLVQGLCTYMRTQHGRNFRLWSSQIFQQRQHSIQIRTVKPHPSSNQYLLYTTYITRHSGTLWYNMYGIRRYIRGTGTTL